MALPVRRRGAFLYGGRGTSCSWRRKPLTPVSVPGIAMTLCIRTDTGPWGPYQ